MRLRIKCLILIITYVAILHGEVCINRPLLCNTDLMSWNTDAWEVFVHTPQWHSTITYFLTQKPSAHHISASLSYCQKILSPNCKKISEGVCPPLFSAHLYSFISTFNCSEWQHILSVTKAVLQYYIYLIWDRKENLEQLLLCECYNLYFHPHTDIKHDPDWKSITVLNTSIESQSHYDCCSKCIWKWPCKVAHCDFHFGHFVQHMKNHWIT